MCEDFESSEESQRNTKLLVDLSAEVLQDPAEWDNLSSQDTKEGGDGTHPISSRNDALLEQEKIYILSEERKTKFHHSKTCLITKGKNDKKKKHFFKCILKMLISNMKKKKHMNLKVISKIQI